MKDKPYTNMVDCTVDNSAIDQIVRLYELQLIAGANAFNLWVKGGRRGSANALAELFFGLTRTLKPHTFIEAGANDAATSLRIRSLCPETEIYAYEANPYNHSIYSKEKNFTDTKINYLAKALGDRTGSATFHVQKIVRGEEVSPVSEKNSLLRRVDASTTYDEVTVPLVSLNSEFPTLPANTIWIDVEGATGRVIEGGNALLCNTLVAMVEVSDKLHWEGEWLATKVIAELYKLGLIPVARDFEYANQYNILFVKSDIFSCAEVKHELVYYQSVLLNR